MWLDDYVEFSRKWSPRAYDDFHEACALWLLSTIAARRLVIHMGKPRHTQLYIALVARTSIYAKSTTAEIAIQTLKEVGLDHLLMPDTATPQKFINIMAQGVVETKQQDGELTVQFTAGQRGWFYEEFGQHVAAMMKSGGVMHDFLFMLRKLDDDKGQLSHSTISRGDDIVENPYLALLACMTPDCLMPFAKRGSMLWGDGFLARFALVCPLEDTKRRREPFPKGRRRIPPSISTPLREWNERLGNEETVMRMTKQVRSAFEAYDDDLLDLLEEQSNHDLDGNYAKLAERTLRIAVLLASVSGYDSIRMKHWEKAQEITERWRVGVNELYVQVNESSPSLDEARKVEERMLKVVQKHPGATAAIVHNRVKNRRIPMSGVADYLNRLVAIGLLTTKPGRGGVPKYWFPTEDDDDEGNNLDDR